MRDFFSIEDIKFSDGQFLELLVESWSNSARTVQVRGFTKESQILHDHTTNSDRTRATSTVRLSEAPIALTVNPSVAGVKRGELYVRVSLRAGGVVIGLLGAAYVTDGDTVMWPDGRIESASDGHGLIRRITGTNPAAGAEVSETVPTGARWKINGLMFTLVTDATGGNRVITLVIDDGTTDFFRSTNTFLQGASSTRNHSFAAHPFAPSNSTPDLYGPIPADLVLPEAFRIKTETSGLAAGDNFAAPQLFVEEWIEL